jgi:uncharacterized membrane protein YqjE
MATWEKTDRSMPEVLQDIVGNIQEIIRSEVRLAKAEMREQASKAAKASTLLGAGALAGIFSLALILATCTLALAMVVPAWLAALIVGIATGLLAAVLIAMGRTRLKEVNATPKRTIHNVKENVQWAKEQTK